MPSQTPFAVPFPLPTDPVSAGANDIRAVAEALDAKVLAGLLEWGDAGAPVDIRLVRAAAGVLEIYQHLHVAQSILVDLLNTSSRLYFGSAFDTAIYRSGASALKTDGSLRADGTLSAGAVVSDNYVYAGVGGGFSAPSGTPGPILELGQGGAVPNPPGNQAARIYDAWVAGKNALMVVWPSGARTQIAIEP
jgi:hypothetical protein